MAEETSHVLMADDARAAMEALLEQERVLRYERFGAEDALRLGGIVASLAPSFGEGVSVLRALEQDLGVAAPRWTVPVA